MALVNCKECGEKVSTEAKSCPSCGCKPPKKKSFILRSLLFSIIAFFVYVYVTNEESTLTPKQKAEMAAMNSTDDEESRQYAWMEQGKSAVLARLKDSQSAEFKDVYFFRGAGNVPMTCGQVNSKNSFGGYVGFKHFISAGTQDFTFLEGEAKDFASAWNKYCTK